MAKKNPFSNDILKYVTKVALLSAIAMLIGKLDFPLWFSLPFYKLDFSAVFVLLGAFALGPTAGALIPLIKNLLKIAIFGSTTQYVGELADLVTLILLAVPAALIYKYRKNIKGAVVGMIAGIVCMTAGGCLFNYFVLIPFFADLYGMEVDKIVAMGTEMNSHITSLRSLVMLMVAPFNLFKGFVCALVTFLLYKRVSKILHL